MNFLINHIHVILLFLFSISYGCFFANSALFCTGINEMHIVLFLKCLVGLMLITVGSHRVMFLACCLSIVGFCVGFSTGLNAITAILFAEVFIDSLQSSIKNNNSDGNRLVFLTRTAGILMPVMFSIINGYKIDKVFLTLIFKLSTYSSLCLYIFNCLKIREPERYGIISLIKKATNIEVVFVFLTHCVFDLFYPAFRFTLVNTPILSFSANILKTALGFTMISDKNSNSASKYAIFYATTAITILMGLGFGLFGMKMPLLILLLWQVVLQKSNVAGTSLVLNSRANISYYELILINRLCQLTASIIWFVVVVLSVR